MEKTMITKVYCVLYKYKLYYSLTVKVQAYAISETVTEQKEL